MPVPEAERLSFSALQRAEIAEIQLDERHRERPQVSVLFNEPKLLKYFVSYSPTLATRRFSALQRAEIAEIAVRWRVRWRARRVSVLFNEPKLLKFLAGFRLRFHS